MSDTRPVIGATIDEWPPFDLGEEPLEGGLVLIVAGELDSIGLASILHTRSRLGEGGRLALVLARESYPQLVLETAGLGHALELFETRAEAAAFVSG